MKQIQTIHAVGHVLCHDLTQIIPNEYKGARFRKGHVVTEEDIPVLLSMGKEHLYVLEPMLGYLHEDEGAEQLAALCTSENTTQTIPTEGKIEVFAACDGLFQVRTAALEQVNSIGELMIATRHGNTPVKKGDKLLGTRVIPLMIAQEKLEQAKQIASGRPLVRIVPYQPKVVSILVTGNEVEQGRIQDQFSPVVAEKLKEYGAVVRPPVLVGDHVQRMTEEIHRQIANGAQMVVCTGGMSVDPDDRTPLAIRQSGATVVQYGAPVLPGAMFLLAYLNDVPICGLPGCVMYAKRTIFDLVLPKLMANLPVCAREIAALGEGGLCLNCPTCIYPNCGFGKGGLHERVDAF